MKQIPLTRLAQLIDMADEAEELVEFTNRESKIKAQYAAYTGKLLSAILVGEPELAEIVKVAKDIQLDCGWKPEPPKVEQAQPTHGGVDELLTILMGNFGMGKES